MSRGIAYRLFSGPDIRDCLSSREADTLRHIDAISDTVLLDSNLEELVAEYVGKGQLIAPKLDLSDIHICEQGKTQIDVRNDPYRLVLDQSKPALVDGQFVTIGFPVLGNASLLEYRPVTYGFTNQNAGVREQMVEWYVEATPSIDPKVLKADQEQFTQSLTRAVESLSASVAAYNMQLESRVSDRLKLKKAEALGRQNAIDSLGIPVKLGNSATIAETTIQSRKVRDGGFKYDAFISHAWEDKKEVVKPLSELLIKAGCNVWLDELEMEIGDSLPRKISEGLSNSRFGIVVFSPAFIKKYWPQHELDGLLAKESSSGQKVILPVWHNLGKSDMAEFSLPISVKVAGNTSDGIENLAQKLLRVINKTT